MFNFFKTGLNYKKFRQDKKRRYINNGVFNDAEVSITWLSKVVITLFFTPVVAVTSLFAKNSIVGYANIFLFLCQTANFLYNAVFHYTSFLNSFLTFTGLIVAALIAISFTANFFPVSITLSSILFSFNVVATAINSFFAIKGVIIPPIKKVFDMFLKFIGTNFNTKLYIQKDLELPPESSTSSEDLHAIKILESLLAGAKSQGLSDSHTLKLYNNMLHMLLYYINKYNEAFLGNIRNQDKIKSLEKQIESLTFDGNPSDAQKELSHKHVIKRITLDEVKRFRGILETQKQSKDLSSFNTTLRPYLINFQPVTSVTEKAQVLNQTLQETDQYIKKLERKIEALADCIPAFYIEKYKNKPI